MKKIVVAVTGASGAVYAKCLLSKLALLANEVEVALLFSEQGEEVFRYELGDDDFQAIGFKKYSNTDFYAPFASGSSSYEALIVIPCSMGTLAIIANGMANSLIARTADVMLKERRKLILVTRESPLNLIQLQNMVKVTEAGGVICPANPSFYHKPQTIDDLAMALADRVLSLAGISTPTYRWGE